MIDASAPHHITDSACARPWQIVTHSSGNHAQAVAKVASMLGLVSYIVMPENSSRVKADAVFEYGANIVPCGNDPKERIVVAQQTADEHPGCFLLPSYDHPDVMSGQGTLMLEFLTQVGRPVQRERAPERDDPRVGAPSQPSLEG